MPRASRHKASVRLQAPQWLAPEAPLADGLADALIEAGVPVFGATRAAAEIEWSKAFCHEIAGAAGVRMAVAAVCVLASLLGYAAADVASNEANAGINGFAPGALLVLLIDSMIPEAYRTGGRVAGLVTTLGFAVAAGLSNLS